MLVGTNRSPRVAAAIAGVYFFCILASYYVLRPLRDAVALEWGVENLPWLFVATLVAMLVANPLFAALVTKLTRRAFLCGTYAFFIANLLFFCLAFLGSTKAGWVAVVFYVWVSVFNLFAVSLFWAVMADRFTSEQGERLFPRIAAGGTLGAMAGSGSTGLLTAWFAPVHLLWISAVLLAVAIACVVTLIPRGLPGPKRPGIFGRDGMISGIRLLVKSPYLVGICLYLFFHTLGGTIFYFEQAHIVSDAFESRADRTSFFAWIDFAVNGITLTLQLTVAGATISRLGVGVGLGLLPLVTLGGLGWLSAAPTLVAIGTIQVLRRAANYAISRPAREVLYTIVSRDEKYKTKPFIDTFVYRGGDVLGAWGFDGLTGAGLGISMVALVTTPIPILWVALSAVLGVAYVRRRGTIARTGAGPGSA